MTGNPIRCNYPLHWPENWPRTEKWRRKTSAFDQNRTMAQAREFALHELRLLGAHSVEVSSNVHVRADGLPRSGQSQPDDTGVAIYFQRKGCHYVLAVDKWKRVEENLYAIGKHVETIRAQERYGVGTVEHAIRGYQALLPSGDEWWRVLGVPKEASIDVIQSAYRSLALVEHPDHGGSHTSFSALVDARNQGLAARGSNHPGQRAS